MNKTLFDAKVKECGLKYNHIAKCLGITNEALIRKRNGIIPFKIPEVKILKDILNLSCSEIDKIFF